jgi:hypothetical protein
VKAFRREGELFAWVTLGWALVWCGDVAQAWRHSPYDRFGWWAALGWAAWAAASGRRAERISASWLGAAWVFSCVGVSGELNVAQHLGVACAGAAWAGGGLRPWGILLLALGWMPATGWLARGAGAEMVAIFRVVSGAGGAALAWRVGRRV